jgi:hypothetical protein
LAGFWSIVAVDDEKSGQTDRPFFYRKILSNRSMAERFQKKINSALSVIVVGANI